MYKKLLATLALVTFSPVSFAAETEIECSSDSVFSEYSCNQCFDWGTKSEWAFIGLLSDEWINESENSKILYTEQQENPELINLDTDNVEWTQDPSGEDFWEYTDEFQALMDEENGGYVLTAMSSVNWIKSKLGYAYKLERNEASENQNIGLLVYPILSHTIMDDGEISMNESWAHKECVLYKSADANTKEIETPKELPETGPAEFFLLFILAMILAFGVLRFKNS